MENMNYRKFTVLTFLVISALLGYVLFRGLTQVFDWMKWTNDVTAVFGGLPWRVVGGGISGILALVAFVLATMNSQATGFFDDVFGEIRKITWPTGQETYRTSVVVGIMVSIAVVGLFLLDNIWNWLFTWLLS